jgi:SAM-dependent methyltransferase
MQASMAGRAEQETRDVVAAYDFGGLGLVVDIGGGGGLLLAAILRAAPGLRGVLVDRAEVVAGARRRLDAAGVGDRAECVAGDFFEALPAGGDAYVLSRVVHDWGDAEARRILETWRAAVPPGGRLLLVEALLPELARDQPAAIRMDVHMLVLFGAMERTEAQYRRLLAAAGFEVRRVIPTRSPVPPRSAGGCSSTTPPPARRQRPPRWWRAWTGRSCWSAAGTASATGPASSTRSPGRSPPTGTPCWSAPSARWRPTSRPPFGRPGSARWPRPPAWKRPSNARSRCRARRWCSRRGAGTGSECADKYARGERFDDAVSKLVLGDQASA